MMMSQSDLDAIEARLATATPGPWSDSQEQVLYRAPGDVLVTWLSGADGSRVLKSWFEPGSYGTLRHGITMKEAYLLFLRHAPTDIAALLAEVKRLRSEGQ